MMFKELVGALESGAYLEAVGCKGQGIRLVLEVSSWIPHLITYQKSQLRTCTAMLLLLPRSSMPPYLPHHDELVPLGHTQTILSR